jgi:alpha-L-fucosidase 2
MEWQEDFEEADVHHRHASHLWGLFPGTEISPQTPELFAGARRSLERRGDASTGWSMAWKMLFWARLGDGDRANRLLGALLRPATASDINYNEGGGSYANLFCAHPPFQIDGNFGGCAAIAEMLIQSHELAPDGGPIIRLLPALPSAWPEGSARGLCARGAFEFGLVWENGRLTRATILAQRGGTVTVRHANASATYTLRPGETTTWIPSRVGGGRRVGSAETKRCGITHPKPGGTP